MKPTSTVADFIRRGREAGQDALGIAHDVDALVALATLTREMFLRERTESSLRRWRELVAELSASANVDPALSRWLGIEHVRLGRAFEAVALDDATLHTDVRRWSASLRSAERDDVVSRFELDLIAPLTVAAASSRG